MSLSLAWDNTKYQEDGNELVTREEFPFSVRHVVDVLSSFQQLGDNWDSYGAKKPTQNALLGAAVWISLICDKGTPVPNVFPVPNGNIQIEWSLEDVELEIEVVSQSTCLALFEDSRNLHETEWEKMFTFDVHELKSAVSTITSRVKGDTQLAIAH